PDRTRWTAAAAPAVTAAAASATGAPSGVCAGKGLPVCSHEIELASVAAGAAASTGATAKGGSPLETRQSSSAFALASRNVSAGRFHLRWIVARIDVWSYSVCDVKPAFAHGDTITVGTRNPYTV